MQKTQKEAFLNPGTKTANCNNLGQKCWHLKMSLAFRQTARLKLKWAKATDSDKARPPTQTGRQALLLSIAFFSQDSLKETHRHSQSVHWVVLLFKRNNWTFLKYLRTSLFTIHHTHTHRKYYLTRKRQSARENEWESIRDVNIMRSVLKVAPTEMTDYSVHSKMCYIFLFQSNYSAYDSLWLLCNCEFVWATEAASSRAV